MSEPRDAGVETTAGFGHGAAGSNTNFRASADAPGAANREMRDASATIGHAKHVASEAADTVKEQLGVASSKASEAAALATETAATGLHTAAEMLRERSTTGGAATSAAVADRLDSAAETMQDITGDQIVSGLEAIVRRNPLQAMLIAAAAGFMLARATR